MADDDVQKTRSERPSKRRDVPKLDHADTEPAVIETSPPSPLDAGRRYTFGTEIARGGMGRVVEATDTLLGRKVALKAALASEPEAIRRFARETQVTARLEHPSIIPVYDAGKTADGVPFYVMRKVAGRPLSELVQERRTIDERLGLLPYVLAAVDAVAHAHSRGVLHRDLKPANILVGELGETVVIDWGLAKIIDDVDDEIADEDPAAGQSTSLKTRAGQVVGTPGFMAPEQLHGEAATRACDVYALGGTLYHVLAGEPPHAARSSDEMIALALSGPPRPIDDLASGVPGELATIVERALAYDKAERFADGAALAAELRRFLTGQLVASHDYSALERAVRFVKRHRAATAVTLIALAVLGVVAYLSITRIVTERNAADDARELALVEARAAEAARQREAERADDLLVSQAAALIATNPTAAVGLLHQLPPTASNWKKARDVLAEARTRGVPWALPASGFTSGLVLTRDGKRAFSAGNDGVVRGHDLETHATKELVRGSGSTLLALAADDKLLAIATGSELIWLYPATGALDRVALERPIEHLTTAGDAAVFHDGQALHVLRHGASPIKIEGAAGKVFGLAASPDGARVVVNAQPDALVIDLSPAPKIVLRRPSRSMEPAWSADGKRLALASLASLDEIDFSGTAPQPRAIATIPSVQTAAYVGEDLYFTTGTQSYRYHPRDGVVQIDLPAGVYSSAASTRDGAVFVGANGLVAVTGRGGTLTLRGPVPRMFRAIASPHATRFIVAVHDHLLAYDAALLLPRMIDTPLANTTFHGFTGNRHYLMGYMLDDWKQFELATLKERSLGRAEFGAVVDAAADGSYVIARPRSARELLVFRPDKPPMELTGARHAVAVSPSRILYATDNEVMAMDLGPNKRSQLWSTTEPIRRLAGAGRFVVAVAKTKLWRRDDQNQLSTTVDWTAPPAALAVDPEGNAWLAVEASIWKWSVDGQLARVGQLARPIRQLTFVAGTGCVAIDDRRGATIIAEGQPPRSAAPTGYELHDLAKGASLAAGLTQDRRIVVYDLDGRHVWSLGAGEDAPDISDDGKHVATFVGGQIAIYALELPADRTAYEAWLDATTNLRITDSTNELVWP